MEMKLLRIESRRYRASVLSGILFTLSVCFWIPCVYLTLDATLFRTHSPSVRMFSTVGCLLIGLAVFFLTVVRTVRNKHSLFDTAKAIHLQYTSSDEDLYTSTIDFLAQRESGTSEAMRDSAVQQAAHELAVINDDCLVNHYRFYWAKMSAAVTCACLIILIICLPVYLKTSVNLFFLPLGSAAWPKYHLFILENPIWTVVRGHPWQVTLVDQNGKKLPDDVRLIGYYQKDDLAAADRPNFTQERVRTDKNMDEFQRKCRWSMETVRASFSFSVTGRDEQIGPFSVHVVDPVLIEDAHLHVSPPEYTHVPKSEQKSTEEVPENSNVTLHIRWSRPIQSAFLEYVKEGTVPPVPIRVPSKAMTAALSDADESHTITSEVACTRESEFDFGVLNAHESFSYVLYYETTEQAVGQTNELHMNIRQDIVPRLLLSSPPDTVHELFLPRNSVPSFSVTATDDYGVEKAYFEWFCEGLQETPQRVEMKKMNISSQRIAEKMEASPNETLTFSEWKCDVDFDRLIRPDTKMIAWKLILEDGKHQTIESPSRWVIVVPAEYFYQYIGYEARRMANRLIQVSMMLDRYAKSLERVESILAKNINGYGMDEENLRNTQSQYVVMKKIFADPAYISVPDMRMFSFYIAALPDKKNTFAQWIAQWSPFFREQPRAFRELNELCGENLLFMEFIAVSEPPPETIPLPTDQESSSPPTVPESFDPIRKKNQILLEKIKNLSMEYQKAATQIVSFDQYEKNHEALQKICKTYQTLDAQMRENVGMIHTSFDLNRLDTGILSPFYGNEGRAGCTGGNLILSLQNVQNDFLQWQGDLLDFTHDQQAIPFLKVGQDRDLSMEEWIFAQSSSVNQRLDAIHEHIDRNENICTLDISSWNLSQFAYMQSRFDRTTSHMSGLEWLKVLRMDVENELHSSNFSMENTRSNEYLRRLNSYYQWISITQKESPCFANILRSCVDQLAASGGDDINIIHDDQSERRKHRAVYLLSMLDQIVGDASHAGPQVESPDSRNKALTVDNGHLSFELQMLLSLQRMVDGDTHAPWIQKSQMQRRVLEQLLLQFPWMKTSDSSVHLASSSSSLMIEDFTDQPSECQIPNISPEMMAIARNLPRRMQTNIDQIESKTETMWSQFQWPRRWFNRKQIMDFSLWNRIPNPLNSITHELELVLTAIAFSENSIQKNTSENLSTVPNSEQDANAATNRASQSALADQNAIYSPNPEIQTSRTQNGSENFQQPPERIANIQEKPHNTIFPPAEQSPSTPSDSNFSGENTPRMGSRDQGSDAGVPGAGGGDVPPSGIPNTFGQEPSTLVGQIWGELPARASSVLRTRRSTESFHPLYQRETEAFFRQLLEQRQTVSANDNTRPIKPDQH
ncbi:MAG: hypothetical protein PHE53_06910 [Thermoguttaceae bacterium]|nr:hypothetical protein [Thermoguttaceae bacterium]